MATGEGSRGGHIIGHTKSGKPIYGDARDTAAKVEKGKPHQAQDKTDEQQQAEDDQAERSAIQSMRGVAGYAVGGVIGAVAGRKGGKMGVEVGSLLGGAFGSVLGVSLPVAKRIEKKIKKKV